MNDQKIGVVRHDTEKNGVDYAIDADPVFVRATIRIAAVGIDHQDLAPFKIMAGNHHEMPGGQPPYIVGRIGGAELARGAVQKSLAESRDDRLLASQHAVDQAAREID